MDELVKNILAAYKVGIDSLEWMSPETKRQAQDKLAHFTVKIGYRDKWRDYSKLVDQARRSPRQRHADGRVPVRRYDAASSASRSIARAGA